MYSICADSHFSHFGQIYCHFAFISPVNTIIDWMFTLNPLMLLNCVLATQSMFVSTMWYEWNYAVAASKEFPFNISNDKASEREIERKSYEIVQKVLSFKMCLFAENTVTASHRFHHDANPMCTCWL